MTDTDSLRLLPAQLRRIHDPTTFEFECTDELIPLTEFIGQDRALRSLQFGLGVHKSGYNVFVTGLTGSGKATAIMDYIRRAVEERRAADTAVPSDWCYVYNFDDPDRPNAVSLPAGSGRQLRTDLEELLAGIRANVGRAFSSEEYEHQKRDLFENGQREAQRSIEEAQRKAEAAGFLLRFSPAGIALLPSLDGQPMTPEQFAALPPEQRQQTADRERSLTGVVSEVGERLRAIERDVSKAVRELDRRIAEWVMSAAFDALAKQFEPHEEVVRFLSQLREFSLGSVDLFREQAPPSPLPQLPQFAAPQGQPDPFVAFRCNSFVDNSAQVGPPIIVESNPTWTNLFGRVERRAFLGTYLSDHMMLKAGSVHRANGGYLIVNLIDVMMKPGSWDGLKRLIRTREVGLEDPMEQYGFLTPQALRPEPVPIDVKLVVTGDPMSYFLLSAQDEEFWEMFKVKADFNHQIDRTAENELAYAGFVCAAATREGLRHFDRTGVARLIEQGSRMVDDQEKLSARFGRLRDIIVEADYWAGQSGSELVSAEHVERAINERVYRLNLVEERLRDLIRRGVIMVDVEGAVVGQVNGLAVLDFGDFSFGRPSRITARTFLGQRGVVSIDRESQLSGKIHDKGVLILGGYLGSTYARDKPLSLSASISFEQGYDSVDGDSASLAELCAILSSLAEAPVRQELAMTGSVNQKGEVQPIGGLNQKIEGFHDVCRAIGLSGQQGVIIPSRNRHNLMLRRDVVESVERGDFHLYAVTSVDEAIELLTGVAAGERSGDGTYGEGSINARVDARLREMGEAMRQFGRKGKAEAGGERDESERQADEETKPDEHDRDDTGGVSTAARSERNKLS